MGYLEQEDETLLCSHARIDQVLHNMNITEKEQKLLVALLTMFDVSLY